MLSYVPIANAALQHLGEGDRIESPDQTDSKAARAVKVAWDPTRLFVLSEAHWSFAIRTVAIAERAAHDDFPLALGRRAFPLPADLVSLVEIVDPFLDDDEESYSVEAGPEGSEILVDHAGPLVIRYVRDIPAIADPARWPPSFTQAFTFRLAWQISDEMGADKARKDRALGGYGAALKLAKRTNARTKAPRRQATTPWTAARGRGVARAPGC
jgi:hypothetical protein